MMRTFRQIAIFSLLGLASLACNLSAVLNPGGASSATPISNQASATPIHTDSPAAAATPVKADAVKLEEIHIAQSAPNSVVGSPVTISGEADSTFEQNLVIAISGEDGSQLALSPTTIQAPLGERGNYSVTLTFSVATQQAGRISVYSVSAMTGGLEHLSSVEVTLAPSGASISSAAVAAETIGILMPKPLDVISGGTIQVSGFSEYFFESSLGLVLCGAGAEGSADDLCGSSGNILATGTATINSADVGQSGPFTGTLTYSVTAQSAGRILVYASSPRDGGILHLSSIAVQIKP